MRETSKAKAAWNDYLAMGDGRSLENLLKRYQREGNSPTTRLPTLKDWSRKHAWQVRLAEIAEAERQAIVAKGIAERQNRVDLLDRTVNRIVSLIDARAKDPLCLVAGRESGLVLTKKINYVHSEGDEEDIARVEEYATDGVVLKELREYLKQAAQELGQWTEKREVSGKIKLEALDDEELEQLERLVRKTADAG